MKVESTFAFPRPTMSPPAPAPANSGDDLNNETLTDVDVVMTGLKADGWDPR